MFFCFQFPPVGRPTLQSTDPYNACDTTRPATRGRSSSGALPTSTREGTGGGGICGEGGERAADRDLWRRGDGRDPRDVPWTEVDAGPSAFTSRRAAGADPPLELQNRFGSLEIEEAGDDEGAPIPSPDADYARPPGRPPGHAVPRRARGPRTPREVRDLKSYLMRPVPMRRRSENEQVLGALQHWFRRTRALAAARIGRSPTAPSAWGRGGMRGLLPIYRPVHRPSPV